MTVILFYTNNLTALFPISWLGRGLCAYLLLVF